MPSHLLLPSAGGPVRNLAPYLPSLLRLNGKPLTIEDYPPLTPMFSTARSRRIVLRAGRAVGKTNSLTARMILQCAFTPNHKILVVTPLQEQSDQISSVNCKPMLDESPIGGLMKADEEFGSVRRRQFANGSMIQFSYAFLDTLRLRGKHVGELVVDECCRQNVLVSTKAGDVAIRDLKPGNHVYSFTCDGRIEDDTIAAVLYRGVRNCYRLKLADGTSLSCTSEAVVATTDGWKSLETIVADLAHARAGAAAVGDHAGRRPLGRQRDTTGDTAVFQPARLGPARVQLPEVHRVVRVRTLATFESEERRLRRVVESLADTSVISVLPYRGLVLARRQEVRDAGVARPADLARRGLVADGRRLAEREPDQLPHGGLLDGRGRDHSDVVGGQRAGRCDLSVPRAPRSEQDLPTANRRHRVVVPSGGPGPSLRLPGDGVQDRAAATDQRADVPLVRGAVRVTTGLEPGRHRERGADELQQRRVRAEDAAGELRQAVGQGGHGREALHVPEGVPGREAGRGPRGLRSQEPGPDAAVASPEPRRPEGGQEALPGAAESRPGHADADVQAVRDDRATGRPQRQHEVLRDLPAAAETLELVEYEIVGVEFDCADDVYDLEVTKNHTFFGNMFACSNCQSMDPAHMPVIQECVSASKTPVITYSGTSMTKNTTLENVWRQSSQGVWHTKCTACGFDNAFCLEPEGQLTSIIGDWRDDISEARPGTLCHRCRTPIRPREGRWVHRYPERLSYYAGYHIPQPVLPMHHADPEKWRDLIAKRDKGELGKYFNEVLGEAFDTAFLMVGEEHLKAAAQGVGPNTEKAVVGRGTKYVMTVLGVDWGGGGGDGTSRTKLAAVGLRHDGRADVYFGAQFPPTTDRVAEAREIVRYAQLTHARLIAHDYGGGIGSASEATITHLGWPERLIVPMAYQSRLGGAMITRNAETATRARAFYSLDKARAVQYVCTAIRSGWVRFFDWDYVDADRPGLISDFLQLAEDLVETPTGNIHRVRKVNDSVSDDFAHAVTFGLLSLWEYARTYPDLTVAGRVGPA